MMINRNSRIQYCLLILILLIWRGVQAQSPTASIAVWKDNAIGAYTIIHDDFGGASINGIEDYADTIAYNRDIKITFGAITGECDETDWDNANRMISHGHEIINHSHNHYCGQPVSWCATQYWDEDDFDTEIDFSSSLIKSKTGNFPRFYIFPFDLSTDTMLTYLESIQYLGARAGTQSQTLSSANMNSANFSDPFRVNFFVFGPSTAAADLNSAAQMAIDQQGWAIRELHGVADASWATVPFDDYVDHIDFVQEKQASGDLWVSTPKRVISYQTQRLSYQPIITSDTDAGTITLNWNKIKTDLIDSIQQSPITINIDLDGMTGTFTVFQAGNQITDVSRSGDVLSINVYPRDGQVNISSQGCPTNEICINSDIEGKTVLKGETVLLAVQAETGSGSLTYQWYKDNVKLTDKTGSSIILSDITVAEAGDYYVEISNGVTTKNSQIATIMVLAQEPYNGVVQSIPGKIEAEKYDEGGAGLAYEDLTSGNAGGQFRSEDVDIETSTDVGGGYNVGWTATGEWIEYTVEVVSAGTYDISVRYASLSTNTKAVQLTIDDTQELGTISTYYTGGWQKWETNTLEDVELTAGLHILKLTMTGDFNLNYVNFELKSQDCHGDIGGTAYLDNCNECVGGNTGKTACTQDCHGDWGGTAYVDNCNECVEGNTGQVACEQDCEGNWGGTAYEDNCNECVSGNTGKVACTQDCHGDWGGTAYEDNCENCIGGNTGVTVSSACTQDCHGDWGGTASIDDCGVCSGGQTGKVANSTCTQDCHGDWGGTAYIDDCNNCVSGNTNELPCADDCAGIPGGSAFLDNCSECVGGTTGKTACTADCNGEWGGTAYLDDCNECVGGNTNKEACTQDCNGVFGGTAYLDDCNECVGGNTNKEACTQDCNGVFGGSAYLDDCNECVGGSTNKEACTQDCNGVFGGTAYIDNCSVCVGGNTNKTPCEKDCYGDWGGVAYLDICNDCVGGNTGKTAVTDIDLCVTSIQHVKPLDELQVQPNPFTESVQVKALHHYFTLVIYNMQGVEVERLVLEKGESATLGRGYSKGIYLLHAQNDSTKFVYKLIKQ